MILDYASCLSESAQSRLQGLRDMMPLICHHTFMLAQDAIIADDIETFDDYPFETRLVVTASTPHLFRQDADQLHASSSTLPQIGTNLYYCGIC